MRNTEIKRGLIMEGGAMRGMFTAGVIDVFMENGVVFDGAIGVSAGAAFGCNYKSRQIGRVIRYNTKFVRDKRYTGIGCLLKTGNLYSTEFCYDEVPLVHDLFDFDTFEKNPMEFYVVATDVDSGEPVYHKYEGRADHCFDWIRASASMPIVSRIVEIEGQRMLDGGISDSIPVKYFESIGYNRCIAILTRPKGYRKKKNSLMPLVRMKYRKFPSFIKAMGKRHLMYNETADYIDQREAAGELFVIRPPYSLPLSPVERNPEKLRAVYEIGRKTAIENLEAVQSFLKQGIK